MKKYMLRHPPIRSKHLLYGVRCTTTTKNPYVYPISHRNDNIDWRMLLQTATIIMALSVAVVTIVSSFVAHLFVVAIVVSSSPPPITTTTFAFLLSSSQQSGSTFTRTSTATATSTVLSFVHQNPVPRQREIPQRINNIGCASTTTFSKRYRRRRLPSPLGYLSSRHYGTRPGEEEDMEFDSSIIDGISKFDPYRRMSRSEDEQSENDEIETDVFEEMEFLRNELVHLESLEDLIHELEKYSINDESFGDDYDPDVEADEEVDMEELALWDEESLDELLNNLPPSFNVNLTTNGGKTGSSIMNNTMSNNNSSSQFYRNLEQVLLQGVVPAQADVGSDCLVGDFGFDPLHLSDVDLFRPAQKFLLQFIPSSSSSTSSSVSARTTVTTNSPSSNMHQQQKDDDEGVDEPKRPRALILRDYREAEIRHGRLAMLAAMIWPLQEMVDKFILSEEQFGPLLYGPVTLPYFPLFMTAIMLLLGYLDIYSQAIKDMDQIGDAFLPGDCFWDPLQVLQGAPDKMRRNMQERELFNGRAAMIAIGAYIVEESITHKALVDIGSNALLLQPAYEIPFIQEWLDQQFTLSQPAPSVEGDPSVLFTTPNADDNASMLLDTLDALVQSTMLFIQSILL